MKTAIQCQWKWDTIPFLELAEKYYQANEYKAQMTEHHDKGDIFLLENMVFSGH